MAKVDFKLNDSLVRRVGEQQPSVADSPANSTADERSASTRRRSPTGQAESKSRPPRRGRRSTARQAATPTRDAPRQPEPAAAPARGGTEGARERPRPFSLQTSVQLPPFLWDRLAELAGEAGGIATANRLLVAILEADGPGDLSRAGEDLERFLAMPAEQTGLGEHWEERNVRLPLALRKHLDELRQSLTAVGLGPAIRSHLIAACVLLRGPDTAEQARELMSAVRADAFRRALAAAEKSPTAA